MTRKSGKHAFGLSTSDVGAPPNGDETTAGVIDPESSAAKISKTSTQLPSVEYTGFSCGWYHYVVREACTRTPTGTWAYDYRSRHRSPVATILYRHRRHLRQLSSKGRALPHA